MNRPKYGFTLIELLVVIAIIALLMSILAPALTNVMAQAKDALCMARLHEWSIVFNLYAEENDGRLTGWHQLGPGDNTYSPPGIIPGTAAPTWPDPGEYGSHEQCWVPRLRKYWAEPMRWVQADAGGGTQVAGGEPQWTCTAVDWDFLMCPATEKTWADGEFGGPKNGWSFKWIHDMVGSSWYYYMDASYGSYGKNSWITESREADNYSPGETLETSGVWRTTRVRNARRIPLFGDNSFPAQHIMEWYAIPEDRVRSVFDAEFRPCQDRHRLKVNWVFLDYTVKEVGLRQLWQLYWHKGWDLTQTPDPRDIEIWPKWLRPAPMYELGF